MFNCVVLFCFFNDVGFELGRCKSYSLMIYLEWKNLLDYHFQNSQIILCFSVIKLDRNGLHDNSKERVVAPTGPGPETMIPASTPPIPSFAGCHRRTLPGKGHTVPAAAGLPLLGARRAVWRDILLGGVQISIGERGLEW